MKKTDKLKSIRQSRPREPMPRPTVFADRSKYDRKKIKSAVRKLQREGE